MATIHAYLRDGWQGDPNVIDTSGKDSPLRFKFHNTHVYISDGKAYVMLPTSWHDEPTILQGFESFSLYCEFEPGPRRARGVYKLKNAQATLDTVQRGKQGMGYSLKLKGAELDDVLELHNQIRAGVIVPEQSWEAEQTHLTETQQNRITELEQQIRGLREDGAALRSAFAYIRQSTIGRLACQVEKYKRRTKSFINGLNKKIEP